MMYCGYDYPSSAHLVLNVSVVTSVLCRQYCDVSAVTSVLCPGRGSISGIRKIYAGIRRTFARISVSSCTLVYETLHFVYVDCAT